MALSPVYLYILMRTDLASLNPGKAAAQASHCSNQMKYEAEAYIRSFAGTTGHNPDLAFMLKEWEQETGKGFGTCIVLGVKEAQMREVVAIAEEMGLHAGITHDPTYPLLDGETLHLIPLDTCAYIFARKSDAALVVGDLSLLP
ncbi:unnamed protein product [Sphagnum tenellum]